MQHLLHARAQAAWRNTAGLAHRSAACCEHRFGSLAHCVHSVSEVHLHWQVPALIGIRVRSGYTVQWTTRDFGRPEVAWGTTASALSAHAAGSFLTYTVADMCGAPANTTGFISPGALNYAIMAPLTPSTQYYYKVGDPVSIYHSQASPIKESLPDGSGGRPAGGAALVVLLSIVLTRDDAKSTGMRCRSWGTAAHTALSRRHRRAPRRRSGFWQWRTWDMHNWMRARKSMPTTCAKIRPTTTSPCSRCTRSPAPC